MSARKHSRHDPDVDNVVDLLPSHLRFTVRLFEIALRLAVEEWPDADERPRRLFEQLAPGGLLEEAPPRLYEAHCREMIERLRASGDLRPLTLAEMAAVLTRLSLDVPLTQASARALEALLRAAGVYDEPGEGPGLEDEDVALVLDRMRRRLPTWRSRGAA